MANINHSALPLAAHAITVNTSATASNSIYFLGLGGFVASATSLN